VGKGEKVFFLPIPLATKLGTFHWPPSLEHAIDHQALEHSIGHQAWEHSIGHQAWDLPSPPLSFSLEGELGSLGGSLSPDIIFN
jgi:hypothetical protein